MSIKKLFESTNKPRNYLSETDQKNAFKDVESAKNVGALEKKQTTFIPQVDYNEPKNFAKYGSANLYYKSAINRIVDYFPYDGSDSEITEFFNKSLDIEKFVFDNLYPRTTGYALLSADGWGSNSSLAAGYGLPSTLEYIEFKGGPHTVTSSTSAGLFEDPATTQRNFANVYDTNIYTTAGLESNYGTGSRESNLECNFDKGVTVEFWMKKDAWAYDQANRASTTYKEVIFDLWNGGFEDPAGSEADHNYGRITLVGDPWQNPTTPLLLTVRSGSTGWQQQPICSTALSASIVANGAWKHYALTIQNTGSQLVAKLYVTGALNKVTTGNFGTLGVLPSKTSISGAMHGRIGALAAAASAAGTPSEAGGGKLSASMDEFRFWKVARNGDEIYKNWFTQVRGGTNTDISNTTLGVYYKFNAGITTTASIDNNVLDYSGRISNGNWIGYGSNSRSTGSAIVESTASAAEYKDPIIRSMNPNVVTLKEDLQRKGTYYDYSNNTSFKSLLPGWIIEEAEDKNTDYISADNSNIDMMSHILGTYFDKLRLQIEAVPKLRNLNYTSASYTPIPFAEHLPQSLGLYSPEIFVEANVLEKFANRTNSTLFEGDLTETKNLIYQNLYNNLTNIYKSKGTEKAVRNVLRCFNADDKLIRLNAYANNQVYELKNNLQQTLVNRKTLNFNTGSNAGGVVYQARFGAADYLLTNNWWSTSKYTAKSSLVGWWRLDADVSSAGNVTDDSTNSNNGTFDASGDRPAFSARYPSSLIQTASCTFDGTAADEDSINIGTAATWDAIIGNDTSGGSNEKMTLAAWVYKTGDGGSNYGRIMQFGEGSSGEIEVLTTPTETIKFNTYWNGASVDWETSAGVISWNTWAHVVVTYDATATGNTPVVYVNGTAVSVTQAGTAPAGSWDGIATADCYIGNNSGQASGWQGDLADVAIWNTILTEADVKALYNAKNSIGQTNNVAQTLGYIAAGGTDTGGSDPVESIYGFTLESDIIFPNFEDPQVPIERNQMEISLMGMCSASTDNGGDRPLNDTTWYPSDNVSFQVYALRDAPASKNVRFKLTSSLSPDSTVDGRPFPTLTSSTFYDVYDNQAWNISVRLKPSLYPLANIVTGATTFTYDLEFAGINAEMGTIYNSFNLTASISKIAGDNFLKSAKRLYVGARRHNVTGALSASSDVLIDNTRYWLKYLDDTSLNQHAYDVDNYGISSSYQHTSPFDANLKNKGSVLNLNMLALNWTFNSVSASDALGSFYVKDISSGSAQLRDNYGWVGDVAGYQLVGSGSGWPVSTQSVIQSQSTNAYQFINPELAISSDMIQIMTDDDDYFGIAQTPPTFNYLLEKSMYNAISEEMLDFFAGVVDFNNVIGAPVNRYRARYKTLEKLREIFFRKVTEVKEVEKFLEYYKWFDDAIAEIIGQLVPASSEFKADIYNTIESHVLERNKYWTKYPTLEYTDPEPVASTTSGDTPEEGSEWDPNSSDSPVGASPRPTNIHAVFWKTKADRSAPEITSGDSTIDSQRNTIRNVATSVPTVPTDLPSLTDAKGNTYKGLMQSSQQGQNYSFGVDLQKIGQKAYRGGINYIQPKSLAFMHNALYPAGPVNHENKVFVPQNVLFADTDDMVSLSEIATNPSVNNPNRKLKRILKVQHGRDWENGTGYSNVKSSYAFPFSILSSSLTTGYNKQIVDRVGANLELVNLHTDGYGPDMEVPMQGPFTDHNVGGHQSRHVPLNTGSVLNTYRTRPEAWKLLLGKCSTITGAIGLAGVDYPWPDTNDVGIPYPMTASQKAVYYRNFIAKAPVNIRNITSSMNSVLGNYRHNYEIIQSVGAFSNPRHFIKYQPPLPTPVVNLLETVPSASTNVVGFFPTLRSPLSISQTYLLTNSWWSTTNSGRMSKQAYTGQSSLVGWWRLDADVSSAGDITDDSTNSNNGTFDAAGDRPAQSLALYPSKVIQSASCTFDATDDAINIGSAATWNAIIGSNTGGGSNKKMSFSAWVYKTGDGGSNYGRILQFGEGSSGEIEVLTTPTETIKFNSYWNGASVDWETSAGVISLNTWAHIVITYDATATGNTPIVYVNGASVSVTQAGTAPAASWDGIATAACYIGNNSGGASGWEGQLADVGVWNAILSEENVKALFQATVGVRVTSFDDSQFNWNLTYAPVELTGSTNKTVFVSRFAAPGSPDVMCRGFLDIRGAEYSPYNALPFRNLSVLRPWQPPSGTISQPTGAGIPGIRIYDIHGKDYGLVGLLARHSARFGRDSIFETAPPGQTYNQLPSFQQVNRNRLVVIKSSSTDAAHPYETGSQFDNAYVQHAIPRSTRQYSWFSGALISSDDMRYYRYAPAGSELFSGSTGYVEYFSFITGSAIAPHNTVGAYQPIGRLNIFTLDPMTGSTSNIIGYPATSDNTAYFNSQLIETLPAADSEAITGSSANFFNLLMARRENTYGWNWTKTHQNNNPILLAEASSSVISLTKESAGTVISSYRMTPASMKGRQVLMNLSVPGSSEDTRPDKPKINNITLKATNNNARIFFNNIDLDNFFNIPLDAVETPYDKLTALAAINPYYKLKWLLYTEGVYPSDVNEMYENTTTRTDYNNKFWRNARTGTDSRASVGNAIDNSFARSVSQSCWLLDAQDNFLTRTSTDMPEASWNSASNEDIGLISSGAAGELQNNYFFYFTNADNPYQALAPASLYARKHMLQAPKSVSPWTNIPQSGTNPNIGEFSTASALHPAEPYAGEAFWEADTLAGRVIKRETKARFEGTASQPWFNVYDDFRYDLKLLAKDYSILPEFRISEHIEDYSNYGILSQIDTFEIPGTLLSSSQDTFYKDYSNSEFMKEFRNIPDKTNLPASEIRLVMSAAIRFNPYKGFYPAQRTVDLVNQFSKSYGSGLMGKKQASPMRTGNKLFQTSGSLLRPLIQPLFAPGILYNTIKAGVAVDYPVLIDDSKFFAQPWTSSASDGFDGPGHGDGRTTNDWALLQHQASTANDDPEGYHGGEWFDQRIPFEAIIEPASHITDVSFVDCEPHPSVSLAVSASFTGESDGIYSKMSSNFFGEVASFFLKNKEFSSLRSGIIADDLQFRDGDVFGARVVMQRAWEGSRTYGDESGSDGGNTYYAKMGAKAYSGSGATVRALPGFYPLPQDPIKNVEFKPKFVPYTRPTAYGPPIAGRPRWYRAGISAAEAKRARQGDAYGVHDFANGHNWAYTPPYFYGESWCDLIFRPTAGTAYDLDRILSEMSAVYWRADPGGQINTNQLTTYALIPKSSTGSNDPGPPYGGANINSNAMQLSASVNLFGMEAITEQSVDEFGNLISDTNKIVGKQWVIQSKFETPSLNFSDNDPVHPISTANSTLTLPTYGSASVPRGMWHQFGVTPTEADSGVFLKIGDIPTNWLKYHYDVITNDTVYNNDNAGLYGKKIHKKMKSLTQMMGFDRDETKTRLGEMASKQVIKEAVVAVPYITTTMPQSEIGAIGTTQAMELKKFVSIPKERFKAAMSKGTPEGDSLEAAGASIRELVQTMEEYILPPEFDFINNPDVKPMVMYMFEFEYELDQDDLVYIWQNLAPRDYRKISLENYSVAHALVNTELLEPSVLQNEDLRWMVFKVKQRADSNYYDKIISQVGESSEGVFNQESAETKEYELMFNWPYDYVSIVEMAKLDVQVLYKK